MILTRAFNTMLNICKNAIVFVVGTCAVEEAPSLSSGVAAVGLANLLTSILEARNGECAEVNELIDNANVFLFGAATGYAFDAHPLPMAFYYVGFRQFYHAGKSIYGFLNTEETVIEETHNLSPLQP